MIRAGLKMCPHGGGQDRGIAVDDQTVDEVVASIIVHVQGGEASALHAGGVVRQAEVAAEEVASNLSSCLGIPFEHDGLLGRDQCFGAECAPGVGGLVHRSMEAQASTLFGFRAGRSS